jgi:UPF0755 protein
MEELTEVRPSRAARNDDGPPRRRLSLVIAFLLFLAVMGAVAWGANRYQSCRSAPAEGPTVTFVVPDGATGEDVVQRLTDQGLMNCGGFVGNLLLRGTGKADEILAGSYELRTGMTLDEIVTVLTTPPPEVPTVRLTVPEGLRIRSTYPKERSISSEVADQLGLSEKKFAALAEGGKFALPPYLPEGTTAEGFLFPETYQLPKKGLKPQDVIQRMLEQFDTEATAMDLVGGAKELGYSPYEVVIIASMIEKEARVQKDRPLIAGVIYNRLRQGMTLGIDATLLYQDPTPDGQLTDPDLATDNPYNTRINAGLPPSPIASPGAASLKAALHPAETDYLYYVLCGADGSHRFAKTYDEHLRNVRECLG